MRRFSIAVAVLIALAVAASHFVPTTPAAAAELPADIVEHLGQDPYVYISSSRKSGDLGAAAEIWFSWDGKTVLVGTGVTSHRVKRIKAGRTAARIWVENTNGPWFGATGALLEDKASQDQMIAAFAKKYGEKFTASWQAKFRAGFDEGTRVVVRYTPTGTTGNGPEGLPPAK